MFIEKANNFIYVLFESKSKTLTESNKLQDLMMSIQYTATEVSNMQEYRKSQARS
jgi:hypothetical protein